MKIILIYPNVDRRFDSLVRYPFFLSTVKKIANKFSKFPIVSSSSGYIVPPLNLLAVAANTPPGIEIEFVDERVEEINFNSKADLVGISVMTSAANHSYEVSRRFMNRGIPVVLGGIHPSLLPDEAIKHADSVAIGEVEGIWENIIEDCKNKKLKKLYKNDELPSLEKLPIPRFDLLKKEHYLTTNIIETSRGCPFKCSFCAASSFFGNKYRFRPVSEIINEIKTRKLENQHIVFVSDNIFGDKNFAKSLFSALIPLNITWMGGATTLIGNHPEILKLAAKSGCKSLLIGFESISDSNLKKIDKNQNSPRNYPQLIKKIHKENIGITGNFIIGLEDDQSTVFDEISRFIHKNNIECPQISILIPYPGTKIYELFHEEKRIFDYNWTNYANTTSNVVFQPKNMSVEDLKNGYWKIYKKVYSGWSICKRLLSTRNFLSLYFPYNILLKMKLFRDKNALEARKRRPS